MIRLYSVSKCYQPGQYTLEDVTLRIKKGDFTFLTGVSGAGKSTMLKLIFGAEQATDGRVVVMGRNLSRSKDSNLPYLRRSIGVVFQDFKLIQNRTVFDNVALTLEVQRVPVRDMNKRVDSILRKVGLEHRRLAYPAQISGGEQQRVSVARAMVGEPSILLADEPTGNLDDDSANAVMDLLRTSHANGATVIVATHDFSLFSGTYHRVIKLENGKIVHDSRPVEMEDKSEQ